MIENENEFRRCLIGTPLESCELATANASETGSIAFVLKIESSQSDALWRLARKLLPATGRWPIVSMLHHCEAFDWSEIIESQDIFSRFYYREEDETENVAPESIVASSEDLDMRFGYEKAYRSRAEYFDLDETIEYELSKTKIWSGFCPKHAEVASVAENVSDERAEEKIDNFLLDWELKRSVTGSLDETRLDWYEHNEDPCSLIFLPTSKGYEALAYIHWYGSLDLGAAFHVALHKEWNDVYGAELKAHYGTMLQFTVNNPPDEVHSAWQLANQHDLISPYTLGACGITIRHYAMGLIGYDRWIFHERP